MTSSDIKQMYSMRDIIERYGLVPDRKGFVRCPFHEGDNDASMKIYDKDYNCFGCGANGDIFTFVQEMEGLAFKKVFAMLGGEYEHSLEAQLKLYRVKKERERIKLREQKIKNQISLNNLLISTYRKWLDYSLPLTQEWCDCYNELQKQLRLHEILNEKR